jgi:diaminohydroxyphosphoribosylaminopyrimidine deaminase / 5-amino-6-(5-phosphoribosylamino)uracil reductase
VSQRDLHLLEKAFFEATRAGWLWTAPNPRVGALALAGGHVIGHGYHAAFGAAHAEEAALRDAGAWDREGKRAIPGIVDEMVVSLEPCSATGKKRPPCTQSLLDAGVRRVLVGSVDPDPRHAGSGLDLLRAAGLQVDQPDPEGCAQRFSEQNPAFLGALARPSRPWVLLKWAASLDGKLAADDGTSQWISGVESRAEVHQLRAVSDAVLAGAGTLRADDPSLTARPEEAPPGLRTDPATRQPKRVLLGGASEVQSEARIFGEGGARIWVLGPDQDVAAPILAQADALLRVPKQTKGLDLQQALETLAREHQIRRLFVEGGAQVHGALLAAGLADAVVRYEAPILLGGSLAACAAPSFASPAAAPRLSAEERADLGADLRRAFLLVPGGDSENAQTRAGE